MTPEENKQVARELFARFNASDIPGVLALMTDDCTWLIPGKRERMRTAGLYPRERIAKLFHVMLDGLRSGLKMAVKSAIAEGDQVAVEVQSEGDLKNGRQYRQQYHFAMQFRDGKICAVREYLDTQHAYDVWLAP
jgi:ketosteroid isomerase-like protein